MHINSKNWSCFSIVEKYCDMIKPPTIRGPTGVIHGSAIEVVPDQITTPEGVVEQPAKRRKKTEPTTIGLKQPDTTIDVETETDGQPFAIRTSELRQFIDRFSPIPFNEEALKKLQEAAEAHVISVFEDAELVRKYGSREAVMARDLKTARRIRGI